MNKSKAKIEERILQFLKKHQGYTFKQRLIYKKLGLTPDLYHQFKNILKALSERGEIERGHKNVFSIPEQKERIIGKISFTTRGFGFVSTDSGEDIFIGAYDAAPALHHDMVQIALYKNRRGKNAEGKVIKIIERSKEPLFAVIKKVQKRWVAVPEIPAPTPHFLIDEIPNNLREGQLVELMGVEWESAYESPIAKIKQIIGIPENPRDDLTIIKRMFRLTEKFPLRVLQEIEQLLKSPVDNEGAIKRLDLRNREIFTIDPEDAKDFDDAVSLEPLQGDRWLLGVHISDVSHYVVANSALDREARRRSFTTYFGSSVVPMLPEALSNDQCSLKPGEDHLTFSALITLDNEGQVIDYQFSQSIIRSKRRFSYKEVQAILDGQKNDPLQPILIQMQQLSTKLYQRRKAAGSVDFDIPEPIFQLTVDGIPYDIKLREYLASHRLIEEFMLLANRIVAEWAANRIKNAKLPFIYRIHERPSKEAIEGLYDILDRLGKHYRRPQIFEPQNLNQIIDDVQMLPFKNFVEQISLRSMAKARYTHNPISHFGLAFRYYTHFTSPIRRYPDLIVHRLLKTYLNRIDNTDIAHYRRSLPKITKHCSELEIKTLEAERAFMKIKQVRFLASKVGQWFTGVITGVMEFGYFVEISDFLIEGLVHVRTLYDDYYQYDETQHTLKGRKSGRIFRLGDNVKVKVNVVSIPDRRIDLEWGE
jgi:ribonuclease R